MRDSSHSPSRRASFPPFLIGKGNTTCIYPCAATTGCTPANEHAIKQKERAHTSYSPAWLLSILLHQVSTRETAGVLLNTCICESFIPAEQLLHWQKRREWFNIGFCIRSTWWAYFQRSYGRYKSKVCLQPSSVMLKKEPGMLMQAVEYILKWRNISILGTYIFKRKCCPFIFRASQYICRQIITLPPTTMG